MVIAFACLGSFAAGVAVGIGILAHRIGRLCPMFKESCMKNNKNNA